MRIEPSCHLYCTAYRLVLLSHLNIAKLFNDHTLYQEHTPFKFASLIYIGQSSFTFLLHVSAFLRYHNLFNVSYRFVWNSEKIRTIYPKKHENFMNSKPRVQFYWFL